MAVGVTFTLAMAGWGLCEGAQRDGGSVVYRYPGVMSGTLTRPPALAVSSFRFMRQPPLLTGCVMKIADRALSFSINPASRGLAMPIGALGSYPGAARTV